jgi:murein DD-endopeptidase MepM/ murein hydrolase activator NlpD
MALPTATLPAVPTGMSAADPDIQKQYSESIDKVLAALENRGGTNWFQIAGALANPGRTGSASEAFGRAMDVVGQQRQEEEKNALPIAQMRAQLVGQKYQMEQEKKFRDMGMKILNQDTGEEPTVATTPASIFSNPLVNNKLIQTSGAGPRTLNGVQEDHKGYDYNVATNTPLVAPAKGSIIRMGKMGDYGNAIEVKYENGHTALFAHLDQLNPELKPGAAFTQGTLLGATGNTGKSTGPHLHIEHRDTSGKMIDPASIYGAPAPTSTAARSSTPSIQYDNKTRAIMAMQLQADPKGFIKTYGEEGMKFAREIALQNNQSRLKDTERTELQKDAAIANDPSQPSAVRLAAIAKLNMAGLFKTEEIRVPGRGNVQQSPGASAANLFGITLPGVPPVNITGGSGAVTPPSAVTPPATVETPVASTTPAAPAPAALTPSAESKPEPSTGYANIEGFKIPNPVAVAPSVPSQFGNTESEQAAKNKQLAEAKIYDLFLSEKGPLQTATTVAQTAGPAMQQLDIALESTKNMPGGFFAQPKNILDQILMDVGFADEKARERVIATKQFEKNVGAIAISKAKALGANPSNEDRKAIMATFAAITDPQEVMQASLLVQKALLKRELLHAQYLQENAHHGFNAEKTFQSWANTTKLSDLIPELKQFEKRKPSAAAAPAAANIAYDKQGAPVEFREGKWIYPGSGKEYKP